MYHPKGFSDAKNIIIAGKYAYYSSPGNTYFNKLINGLRLEDKFKNDDDYEAFREFYLSLNEKTTVTVVSNPVSKNNFDETLYEDVIQIKIKEKTATKYNKIKQKNVTKYNKIQQNTKKEKNRKNANKKKNKIRQNGYDDKMYFINQQIIKPRELIDEKELEIEEHYLYNLVDDNCASNDYDYDSEKERDMQEECHIEWFRDNIW